jgi:hypothetical protein
MDEHLNQTHDNDKTRFADYPPLSRFLLEKFGRTHDELVERYGSDYTSVDFARSPDLAIRAVFWFGVYLVIAIPETVFIHLKAFAEGLFEVIYKKVKKPNTDK